MKRNSKYIVFLTLALLLLMPSVVLAQEPTPVIPDDAVNAIAKQMFCPVCENIPLDVCGTQACMQWRELIRKQLAEGKTEEEIKQYFVEQYGDRVLAEPPRRGLNWLIYIVPPAAIVVGAFFVYRAMRTWQKDAAPPPTPEGASPAASPKMPDDDYIKRLEDELRKR